MDYVMNYGILHLNCDNLCHTITASDNDIALTTNWNDIILKYAVLQMSMPMPMTIMFCVLSLLRGVLMRN